jgi:hypothetical protein
MSDNRAADAAEPVQDMLRAAGFRNLGENPPPDAVGAVLRNLAGQLNGADKLQCQLVRMGAIAALKEAGVQGGAAMFDASLSEPGAALADGGGQGKVLALSDPEPWPEAVEGPALMDELVGTFGRFMVLPDDGAHVVGALWALHTHAHDAARVSPILAITSPEKRCGKTTLLTLLSGLTRRPLPASNITTAVVYRAVEKYRPTLLIDEADTFLKEREELRGVLNSGHSRAFAQVLRNVGDDHEPRLFSTWGPKAIALIGDLPATLGDRAIVLELRRRLKEEKVEELRLDRLGELEPLRRRASRWAADHLDALTAADPTVPDGLHDRARDNWRPLLAIADALGGPWPERARAAALALSGDAGDGDASGVMLLEDLKGIFGSKDAMESKHIVPALSKLEGRPWAEWRQGKPLTQHGLAKLLKPFKVFPTQYREGDRGGLRGYLKDKAMKDAWDRYLPQHPPHQGATMLQPLRPNDNPDKTERYEPGGVTGAKTGESPTAATHVASVAVANPHPGADPHVCRQCGVPIGPTAPTCAMCLHGGDA